MTFNFESWHSVMLSVSSKPEAVRGFPDLAAAKQSLPLGGRITRQ